VPLTVLGFSLLAIGGWGLVNWANLPARRARPALDLAGELGDAHVGGRRRFATKDDSRNTWWSRCSRSAKAGTTTTTAHPTSARHGLRLVRVRRHLDRAQGPEGDWAGLGCPRRSNSQATEEEVAA